LSRASQVTSPRLGFRATLDATELLVLHDAMSEAGGGME
jgi:hypothetical protein